MKYTREQAEAAKQIVYDFMKHHDICMSPYKWDDFLNAKFPTIEVGKWYKAKKALICATSRKTESVFAGFGFNVCGAWEYGKRWVAELFSPATEQEVLDRLSDHAKNIYKVGYRVMSLWCKSDFVIDDNDSFIRDDYFWFSGIAVLDLSTGEWAEVVEYTPSNPIHDKIEKFEQELAELKELINK
jgi:hypothetical protein